MKIETVLGAPPEPGIGNNAYPVRSEHFKEAPRCGYETMREKSDQSGIRNAAAFETPVAQGSGC